MHNSQNGAAVNSEGPQDNLLVNPSGLSVDACVGCHYATSGATWKDPVTGAPIVWNQNEPSFNAQKGLAGGNFHWVADSGGNDDTKGHNVYGIAGEDANIPASIGAPGNLNCGGKTSPCHKTLAEAPQLDNDFKGGCRGCHVNTYHHTDNGIYRFLHGHEGSNHYVTGIEDPNWEHTPTQANHNVYKGYDGPVNGGTLETTHSISTFCSGCHWQFHRRDYIGGTEGPWTRHPTDLKLPTDGEYGSYNPVTSYSNEAPVAYIDPSSPSRETAVVMCLSCHRPHGTENADLLRWDYDTMVAGGGGSGGCFTCHTNKN